MISKIFLFFYDFIDNKFHMKPITSMINDLKIKNVFDVGAHRGEFSSSLLKNCPLVKKIYAFEPQTSIFNELKQKKNDILKTYNIGLSNLNDNKVIKINELTTTSTFSEINYDSKWFKFKNFILLKTDSFVGSERVKVKTLDSFVKEKKVLSIDLLKIDTEGHEINVLEGAKNFLKKRKVKHILIEFEPKAIIYKNYDPALIHNKLLELGYKLNKTFKFPFHRIEDRLYSLKNKTEDYLENLNE